MLCRKTPLAMTPGGGTSDTNPCDMAVPTLGASMMVLAPGARVTVVAGPTNGTFMEVPLSAVNVTGKETVAIPVLEKYSAEYQPPPNTNWGSIFRAPAAKPASCWI